MTNYTHKSKFFCGNEISEYGLQHGYIDYRTLANSFDAVMNNDIIKNTCDIGYWDIVNERENSVNLDKVVDVVFDTISDYMKGGE